MKARTITSALLTCAAAAACASGPADEALTAATQAALTAAARHTGMAEPQLSVRSAMRMNWPDGSMGCGVPGMRYTMAPVAGFRIVIDAAGRELDYRAGRRGPPMLCRGGRVGGGGAPVR